MTTASAELCTVEFPDHVQVMGKRPKPTFEGGKRFSGGLAPVIETPVVLKDVPKAKALKFASTVGATVKDSKGKVLVRPVVKLTDYRTDRERDGDEIKELRAELAEMKELLAAKANKTGPKTKG